MSHTSDRVLRSTESQSEISITSLHSLLTKSFTELNNKFEALDSRITSLNDIYIKIHEDLQEKVAAAENKAAGAINLAQNNTSEIISPKKFSPTTQQQTK